MPEDENVISRFIGRANDEISRVILRTAVSVALRLRKPKPDDEIFAHIVNHLTGADADEIDISNHPLVRGIIIVTASGIGIQCILSGCFLNLIIMIRAFGELFLTTIATQVQQPKPLKRCLTFSNYSRTPDLKGLKGMRETYIQQTNGDFRQEVEQHQEDTSRAVVPSSGSTGMCTSCF